MAKYELLLINIQREHIKALSDSLGQYLIASYLCQFDYKAYVFSGNVPDCFRIIRTEINNYQVPVIGFYAAADNISVVFNTIKWIKHEWPHTKTIVGGPQAIALDNQFFLNSNNDYAIIGEGEIPMKLLLDCIIDGTNELQNVPSLVRMDETNEQLLINWCDNAIITDLNSLPHPSIEDSLTHNLWQEKQAGILTGRGCPNHCAFCYEGANAKNLRFKGITKVMEEIDYIISINPNVECINIYDDTFTINKERVLNFCSEIKKRNLSWVCEAHINFVIHNEKTFRQMVNSGLIGVQFGIESGNQNVLDAYKKNTTPNDILKAIEICSDAGVKHVSGNFIIGGALEDNESLKDSMTLAKRLIWAGKGMIEINTVYFAPYPNTQITNTPENYQLQIKQNALSHSLSSMRSPVIETHKLTTKDIFHAKQSFDSMLKTEYEIASLHPSKSEFLKAVYFSNNHLQINPVWGPLYLQKQYLSIFSEHLNDEEQVFSPEKYIIRTLEDFVETEENIITEAGTFTGLEKEVLFNSVGKYSARELAQLLRISLEDIKGVYNILNEQCLVYMSEA